MTDYKGVDHFGLRSVFTQTARDSSLTVSALPLSGKTARRCIPPPKVVAHPASLLAAAGRPSLPACLVETLLRRF